MKVKSFGWFACRSQLVRKRAGRGGGSGEDEVAKTDQSRATLRRERQCDETVAANGHQLARKDKKKGIVKMQEAQNTANAITLKKITKRRVTFKKNLQMIPIMISRERASC